MWRDLGIWQLERWEQPPAPHRLGWCCDAGEVLPPLAHGAACRRPEEERTKDGHGPATWLGWVCRRRGSCCGWCLQRWLERGYKVALALLRELTGSWSSLRRFCWPWHSQREDFTVSSAFSKTVWCASSWQPAFRRQVMPKMLQAVLFLRTGLFWLLSLSRWEFQALLIESHHWCSPVWLCWGWRAAFVLPLDYACCWAHSLHFKHSRGQNILIQFYRRSICFSEIGHRKILIWEREEEPCLETGVIQARCSSVKQNHAWTTEKFLFWRVFFNWGQAQNAETWMTS